MESGEILMNAFYKQSPTADTPYRQLILKQSGGWRVRLTGGTTWGREHRQELKIFPANSFDDARETYDRIFTELQAEGWEPYGLFEPC